MYSAASGQEQKKRHGNLGDEHQSHASCRERQRDEEDRRERGTWETSVSN